MGPRFRGRVSAIPPEIRREMTGVSWHDDARCPRLDDLALVAVSHWDMAGVVRDGELVVAGELADAVVGVFERIFAARFPIERMVRIDAYRGHDDASMADNNSSAFNFRTIAGSTTLSLHAFGRAIDINPVQNPYVVGDRVLPPAAVDYLDRSRVRPGMVVRPGPVVDAFAGIGWGWGGDWSSRKDYQHFSAPEAAVTGPGIR